MYIFYEQKIQSATSELEKLKRKIHFIGSLRLLTVIGACITLWFLRQEEATIIISVSLLFVVPFIVLLTVHNKLFYRREYMQTLLQLNQNELNALNYDFSAFDGAKELSDPEHAFGLDLDIFGNHSLFQSVNRTVIAPGKTRLADWFIHPLTRKQTIEDRQGAIKELSQLTDLRQKFYVYGKICRKGQNDEDILQRLINSPSLFSKNRYWKALTWIIPVTWIAVVLLVNFHLLPATLLGGLIIICMGIAFSQTKKINHFHNSVSKMERILKAYSELMKLIENQPYQSTELKKITAILTHQQQKASEIIKQLSVYLGKLDQRYNFLMSFILNVLFLWDIRQTIHIENWKSLHAQGMKRWFDALGQFDAFSSLASFAFNHPDYIYPTIADEYFCMEGKQLGHPLMKREVCVKNDINIPKAPWFLIITGANMAGKSTYLRTIGVNYLLSCIGAPVYAETLTLYPAQLVTSLRTADSLSNNESYFFAELKRLKMIIDRLNRGEKLFIVLDEILKGTNSIDKQKGSLALMKQLISLQACGIIATHDLVLGELESDFPKQIKNYRFEADITNDELTFSYRLREGIAQNMNACFLMKRMGITI